MGVRRDEALASIRLSLGFASTDADVDRALTAIPALVERLREPVARLPMNVLVLMSGGVDSSVAAARLVDDGHDVTGATLRLWGGETGSGCCSVAGTHRGARRRVAAPASASPTTSSTSRIRSRPTSSSRMWRPTPQRTTRTPVWSATARIKFGRALDRCG